MSGETLDKFDVGKLRSGWWYYTAQMHDGSLAKGSYPDDYPMLPRMLLSRINLNGMDCLDIGTVEGLMPILMKKGGARHVLATDFSDFCLDKMNYLKAAHGIDFDVKYTGPLDNLRALAAETTTGFDLVNLSGVLYHVFSPMHIIAYARSLLRNGGFMLITTPVVVDDRFAMHFDESGSLQSEANTFWYFSAGLLDYMLRYFCLAPIGLYFHSHEFALPDVRRTNLFTGNCSVLCRATPTVIRHPQDRWMLDSSAMSWEYKSMPMDKIRTYPPSAIALKEGRAITDQVINPATQSVDMLRTIRRNGSSSITSERLMNHTLLLNDLE